MSAVGEASDAVSVDVGVDVGVCLAAANRVDERRRDCVLTVARGRRYGQVDFTDGVPPGLLVVGHCDDVGVDEPIDVRVGCSLCQFEVIYHVLNSGLVLPSKICVELRQLWLLEEVRDREEVADEVAVGAI